MVNAVKPQLVFDISVPLLRIRRHIDGRAHVGRWLRARQNSEILLVRVVVLGWVSHCDGGGRQNEDLMGLSIGGVMPNYRLLPRRLHLELAFCSTQTTSDVGAGNASVHMRQRLTPSDCRTSTRHRREAKPVGRRLRVQGSGPRLQVTPAG